MLKPSLCFRFVTGEHWTGSPNKSTDQIGKKCPKNSHVCSASGPFVDMFRTCSRHFSDILSTFPFSELSNDLPVTIRWIQEGFTALSAELPKSDSDTCLGQFDSDLGLHPTVKSDFRAVTLTFGPKSPIISQTICPWIISWGFYSKAFLNQRAAKRGVKGGRPLTFFLGHLLATFLLFFGHFLVTLFSFLVAFLPIPFCLPPFAAQWLNPPNLYSCCFFFFFSVPSDVGQPKLRFEIAAGFSHLMLWRTAPPGRPTIPE